LELLGKYAVYEFVKDYDDFYEPIVLWVERIGAAIEPSATVLEVYQVQRSADAVEFLLPTLIKGKKIRICCHYVGSQHELILDNIHWLEG
jgi:hypothetical protein